ncbi:hypothetical protein ALP97_00902 [Pseudomonas salomonii]|uniref:Uncharacterized protein n=2 Tax=Pseudomonas TaxID=286 RepID=A0A0W0HR60_PSEFL|nr:hypothetical protein AO063_13735 [Pseudomonas fluorescens ICMP 11288]RMQ86312.1 hypothetical protein ALP97_00902 [Pseudomonas salomonii]
MFGKIHQLSPETKALGVWGHGEVIQQQCPVGVHQDNKALNLPGVVEHMHATVFDPLRVVLLHWPGLSADALDVGRIGSLHDGLDSGTVIGSGGAYQFSVLLS